MVCITNIMKRTYRLRQRAEGQKQTRQKIVEAAIELHQSKGIAATTIGEIADRANVGKVTVYRHFTDETALLGACSGQYFEQHPLPNIEAWRQVGDASDRLRLGLTETFGFHRETAPMMEKVLGESRELAIMKPYFEHWQSAAEILAEPWQASERQNRSLIAALRLALAFETWHLLVEEQGLEEGQAIEMMMRLADPKS